MTDLETDDMVALYLLSKKIPNSKIMFLVGEGNSQIKKIRMESYVKYFGFKNAVVVRGYSSSKLFPYDGHDVMTEKQLEDIMLVDDDKKQTKQTLAKFIQNEFPFIISLKPPRELIDMHYYGFDNVLSNCVFAGYMSFNIRCLMKNWKKNEQIVPFLKNFKECYFYETYYAVGRNNIITSKDFDLNILPDVIWKVMMLWNKHMVDDCEETIRELRDKKDTISIQRVHRNEKTLKQVLDNNHEQFVNADCGFIISLIQSGAPYKDFSLRYREKGKKSGYPEIREGSDFKVIQPVDKDVYREFQVKQIKFMLKN